MEERIIITGKQCIELLKELEKLNMGIEWLTGSTEEKYRKTFENVEIYIEDEQVKIFERIFKPKENWARPM